MAKLNYWNGIEWVELGAGIISSDSEPVAAPGAIWLDTSDTLYQGTVFESLENQINGLVQSKGAPDGIATLGADGKVPTGQLPPKEEPPFDFDNFYNRVGYTYKTEKDIPTAGSIKTSIINTSTEAVVATMTTEKDMPTAGQIRTTLYVAEDNMTVTKTLSIDGSGNILEVVT